METEAFEKGFKKWTFLKTHRIKGTLLKTASKKVSYTVVSIGIFEHFSSDDRRKRFKKHKFSYGNGGSVRTGRNKPKTLVR